MTVLSSRLSLSTGATRVLHVPGDGPPIVLLHGYGDSAACWVGVLRHLGALGQRAMALDMPGFGEAEPRPARPMIDVLDVALREALDHVGEPAVVVGNSLGCVPALRAAAATPDRVAGVITVSEPTHGFSRVHVMVSRQHESWVMRVAMAQRRMPQLGPLLMVRLGSRVLYARSGVDPAHLRGIADYIYASGEPWRAMREVRELALGAAEFYDLGAVQCPVLVLHGDRDRIIPVTSSRRISAAIPGSELRVLHRFGHCPQVEAPDHIASVITEFVTRRCQPNRHEGKAIHGTQGS